YDGCFSDADCTSAGGPGVCACRLEDTDANHCVGGNCVIDADCGAGGWCSPSFPFDRINTNTAAYYCHTLADECLDDADCTPDGQFARCAYDDTKSHWA